MNAARRPESSRTDEGGARSWESSDSTPEEIAETCRRVLRHREDTHRAALRTAAGLGFPASLSRQVAETRARLAEIEACRDQLERELAPIVAAEERECPECWGVGLDSDSTICAVCKGSGRA